METSLPCSSCLLLPLAPCLVDSAHKRGTTDAWHREAERQLDQMEVLSCTVRDFFSSYVGFNLFQRLRISFVQFSYSNAQILEMFRDPLRYQALTRYHTSRTALGQDSNVKSRWATSSAIIATIARSTSLQHARVFVP